jgi:hypothetical protein
MSKVFKTQSGAVLTLRPVSAQMCKKFEDLDKNTDGKSFEEITRMFQISMAELFEQGVARFNLTLEQQIQVNLARPQLKKELPGLKENAPDYALFILFLVPTYEELARLAVAIFSLKHTGKPEKVKSGFSLPFGRLKPNSVKK